jgi:hypothetical protein
MAMHFDLVVDPTNLLFRKVNKASVRVSVYGSHRAARLARPPTIVARTNCTEMDKVSAAVLIKGLVCRRGADPVEGYFK